MKLGINSMGRIGKLTLWHHIANRHYEEIVVNLGRGVGTNLADLASTLEKDSTYGRLSNFLKGYHGDRVIENLDESAGTLTIDGIPVRILRSQRNPREIGWRDHGVRLVVDCTGVYLDPTAPADATNGALRGHLEAGAEKVILSAPFKIKTKGIGMPGDAVTVVLGINDETYNPTSHTLISAASCTTTCLAFMLKPLLDVYGINRILSASMVTVHAATGSQTVLDAVPAAGAIDLRKSRSVMNNIILTTTGAAKALKYVIPEVERIGFMAESVRIPTTTGSLTILTLNLQSQSRESPVNRAEINRIYQDAAAGPYLGLLKYSEEQNVSADIIGFPRAAVIIEGVETHTRTGFSRIDLAKLPGIPPEVLDQLESSVIEIPVTQAVIYGWYDNELGSYTNMLGELTTSISDRMM